MTSPNICKLTRDDEADGDGHVEVTAVARAAQGQRGDQQRE